MADIRAGRAFIEFSMRDSALRKGLDATAKKLRQFGTIVSGIGAGITGIGAAIGVPLLSAATAFQQYGDAAQKAAARTGLTTEEITELGFAAEQSGSSMQSLVQGVFRMTRRIANAATATGPAVRALSELNLEAEALSRSSTSDQLFTVIEALSGVENEGRKAQLAFEIFGDNVRQLKPFLDAGVDGLEALREQARGIGLSLGGEDAQAAADLGDAWNSFGRSVKAVRVQLGAALAGPLTKIAVVSAEIVGKIVEWVDQNRSLVRSIAAGAAAFVIVGTAITGLGVAVVAAGAILSGLSTIIGATGAALAALVSPIGLVVAGVTTLGIAVVQYFGGASAVIDFLRDRFGGLVESVQQSISAISTALGRGDIQAAANVLWASLRVAWAQGVAYLNRQWAEWAQFFQETYTKATFAFAETLTNGFALAQVAWQQSVDFFKDAWTIAIGSIQQAWAAVQNFVSQGIVQIGGLFGLWDVEGTLDELAKDYESQIEGIQNAQNDAILDRDEARNENLQRIERDRQQALDALAQERQRKLSELQGQESERVTAAQEALKKAQEEWTAAIQTAGGTNGAEEGEERSIRDRINGLLEQFGGLSDGIAAAEQTISATGQFGGRNAGLALGQTQSMESLTKTNNKLTQEVRDEVKRNTKATIDASPAFG